MAEIEKDLQQARDLMGAGEFPAAVKKFNKIIKADQKCAEAYFGKAEAAVGDPNVSIEDAIECYKKALEFDEGNPIYWSSYASFLMDQGRFNDAEAAYNRAAEIDPDNARYYHSEFGVDYAYRAPIVMEKFLDDKTRDMIKKKSLQYLLKSIGMTEDDAKRLF